MSKREQKLLLPTIPSAFVVDALAAYNSRNLDVDCLLEEVGIDAQQIKNSAHRVSVVDYGKLIKTIIERMNDGFLGFLDDPIPTKSFAVFAAQIAACENLRQLYLQANRFYGLFTQQMQIACTQDSACVARITCNIVETQDFDYRFIHQSVLLVVMRLMHWFLGENIKPLAIHFTFEEADQAPYLSYLFDCPVLFSQSENSVLIDSRLLDVPCKTNLEQVEIMLRESTQMMLVSNRSLPFSTQVRRVLVMRKTSHWPNVEDVAATMNLSPNLLWRKLKKENTSFLKVRDEVKRDTALSLIDDLDLSINSLSEKLGFTEPSAFNKAFYKWTGLTPSAYRKQNNK